MQCDIQHKKIPDKGLTWETKQGGFCIATVTHPKSGFYIMEIWKEIEDYEGYEVSNYGRVKSIGRDNDMRGGKSYDDKILALRTRTHGYYAVALYKEGKQKNISTHRLVGKAFVDNPNGYDEINHKDGDKQNNYYENLEWCTHSENCKHAVVNGHHKMLKGTQMHNSKLTEADVLEARKVYNSTDIGVRPLAKKYGVSRMTMRYALSGKTWKHI